MLTILAGFAIGLVLGLTGAGGGILAVPALIASQGWTMQQAAPVALIAVAFAASLGALQGFRHGLVRYRAGVLMALSGMPLTYLGQHWAALLPQNTLRLVFAGVMVWVALRLLLQLRPTVHLQHTSAPFDTLDNHLHFCRINTETGRLVWTTSRFALLSAMGMLTGLMTGLLGVGGGFIMVPLLKRFTEISVQGIVATSLFVIALVGSTGVASAMQHGIHIEPLASLQFVGATVSGMLMGRRLIHHLKPQHVQALFAVVLLCVAIGMMKMNS